MGCLYLKSENIKYKETVG